MLMHLQAKVTRIGNVAIPGRLALAPMAGVNCAGFRLLCRECGASLIYTQMYHCDFLCHKIEDEGISSIREHINILEQERPVAVQLVGSNPERMVKAAHALADIADIIDVNFGCSDDNIIKSGCGAYFTKHIEEAAELVKTLSEAIDKPLTAKIRIGFDSQNINGVRFAQLLEKAGARAIAVHGRVAAQKYKGKANWEIIKHIKDKLEIPIIGNGDVRSVEDAHKMISSTGCDMVMIGRGAVGNPAVFSSGKIDRTEVFRRFVSYYRRYDSRSLSEFKHHALWFSKRMHLGPKIRQRIIKAQDIEEIVEIIEAHRGSS